MAQTKSTQQIVQVQWMTTSLNYQGILLQKSDIVYTIHIYVICGLKKFPCYCIFTNKCLWFWSSTYPLVLAEVSNVQCRLLPFEYVCNYTGTKSQGNRVSIVTRLWAGWSMVWFPIGKGIFLFSTTFRPALWLTQSPVQWVPLSLSPGVLGMVCGSDYFPPSSAKVKNEWS
jgi:hypothetical protein